MPSLCLKSTYHYWLDSFHWFLWLNKYARESPYDRRYKRIASITWIFGQIYSYRVRNRNIGFELSNNSQAILFSFVFLRQTTESLSEKWCSDLFAPLASILSGNCPTIVSPIVRSLSFLSSTSAYSLANYVNFFRWREKWFYE